MEISVQVLPLRVEIRPLRAGCERLSREQVQIPVSSSRDLFVAHWIDGGGSLLKKPPAQHRLITLLYPISRERSRWDLHYRWSVTVIV